MRRQKIVLVDIDSVTIDLAVPWLGRYNRDYDDHLTAQDLRTWDTWKYVKPECGKKIYNYLLDPTLYDDAPLIPGAYEGIQELRACGFRPVFLTAGISRSKFDCLRRHGLLPGEFWEAERDIIIASDKSLILGNLLIDDRIENIQSFSGDHALLFDQPWNRNSDFLRVKNWQEAVYWTKVFLQE